MQITKLKEENTDFHAKIVIPISVINDGVQKGLNNIQKTAKMAGFRTGKVPVHILKNKYGASLRSETVQEEINRSINDIIKNNKLNIASAAKIEELKNEVDQDIEFILKLEIIPEIQIPELNKISIEKPIPKVSPEDVKEELDKIAKRSIIYDKEKEGPAEMGDQLLLDGVGNVDGVEFEGGKFTNQKIVLGSKSFIDNFEDQLVGAKAGDELTVNVTFPQDYHAKDLADKAAEFKVKIHKVYTGETPELNDEFAKKLNSKDLKELEDNIIKYIKARYENDINIIMKMHLFNQLEGMLTFEIPASLLEKEYNILKNQTEQTLKQDDDYKDKTPEEIENYCKKIAARRVRIGLLLAKYAEVKNLRVTQQDLKDAIIAQTRMFPGYENKIAELYNNNPAMVEQIKGGVLETKAVDHIFAHEVQIIEKEYNRKELEELIEKENDSSQGL